MNTAPVINEFVSNNARLMRKLMDLDYSLPEYRETEIRFNKDDNGYIHFEIHNPSGDFLHEFWTPIKDDPYWFLAEALRDFYHMNAWECVLDAVADTASESKRADTLIEICNDNEGLFMTERLVAAVLDSRSERGAAQAIRRDINKRIAHWETVRQQSHRDE